MPAAGPPATTRALTLLARVAKLRRLYQPNSEVLTRLAAELLQASQEALREHPELVLRIRADGIYHEDRLVLADGDDDRPIAQLLYREGLRRLVLTAGLTAHELDVLADALGRGFGFSGLGDDLVSYLWRHELAHVQHVAIEHSIGDALDGTGVEAEDLGGRVLALLAAIYGTAGDDRFRPRSLHVDQADFAARTVAELLADIDELAPGFHPARTPDEPVCAPQFRGQVAEESDERLGERVLALGVRALADPTVDPEDARHIGEALLATYDTALVAGELVHAAHLVQALRGLDAVPHARPRAEAWLAQAMTEARLRPLVLGRLGAASEEASAELLDFVRWLGPAAVPALLGALSSVQSPQRRRALSLAIVELGVGPHFDRVVALVGDAQGFVVDEGLFLARHLPATRVYAHAQALLGREPSQQIVGARLMALAGGARGEELLLERLSAPNLDVAPLALKSALFDAYLSLAQGRGIGLVVRRYTRATLGSPDEVDDTAVAAVLALRLVRSEAAQSALHKALGQRSPRVKEAARTALAGASRELGTSDLMPMVSESPRPRSALSSWLGRLRPSKPASVPPPSPSRVGAHAAFVAPKGAVSTKVVELGRTFLSALFMAVRTAQIHDSGNRAFEGALAGLREATDALYTATGGFTVQLVEGSAFLNGATVRFEGRSADVLAGLQQLLASKGWGGIQLRTPPTYEGLRQLLTVLARREAEPVASDSLGLDVELLGVQAFREDAGATAEIDRTKLAVHSYAKLLLALVEQREALRADGQDVTTRARFRAVRVLQDLAELCAERPDVVLRLAANHRGAAAEDLHAVNTCLIALVLAHALGVPRRDLLDVGVGALFHGLQRAQHAEGGFATAAFARLLAGGGLDRSTRLRALLVAELSLSPDQRAHMDPTERHPYVRLVEVAKAYDTLTSLRSPHAENPLDALAALVGSRSPWIDATLADVLVNLLRAYPRGARVLLSSGESAVVRTHAGGSRWDRPLVDVEGESARPLDLMSPMAVFEGLVIVRSVGPSEPGYARPSLERLSVPAPAQVRADLTDDLFLGDVAAADAGGFDDAPVPLPADALIEIIDEVEPR
jgi:hypothetical protein